MFCNKCGNKIISGDDICPHCGNSYKDDISFGGLWGREPIDSGIEIQHDNHSEKDGPVSEAESDNQKLISDTDNKKTKGISLEKVALIVVSVVGIISVLINFNLILRNKNKGVFNPNGNKLPTTESRTTGIQNENNYQNDFPNDVTEASSQNDVKEFDSNYGCKYYIPDGFIETVNDRVLSQCFYSYYNPEIDMTISITEKTYENTKNSFNYEYVSGINEENYTLGNSDNSFIPGKHTESYNLYGKDVRERCLYKKAYVDDRKGKYYLISITYPDNEKYKDCRMIQDSFIDSFTYPD